jgi:diaminopimelate decarboxylase/aspartate kinase
VYDEATIVHSIDSLKSQLPSVSRIFYAVKANPFPAVLRVAFEKGLGFECVSMGEVQHILALFPDIDRKRILFTPNFTHKIEYEQALQLNVHVTVDNTFPLAHWPGVFRGKEILLRVDPGKGYGHHQRE